jgi:hypothetical protein
MTAPVETCSSVTTNTWKTAKSVCKSDSNRDIKVKRLNQIIPVMDRSPDGIILPPETIAPALNMLS